MGVKVMVPIIDTIADIALILDTEEHLRRLSESIPAVPDSREVFHTLATLPYAEPVRLKDLSLHDRSVVKQLPTGIVDIRDGEVVCRVRPPVRSTVGIVYDEDWRVGLNRASHFAPFGTRVLALTDDTGIDITLVSLEAALYGIGVTLIRSGREDRIVVEPEPWVQNYFGPVAWRYWEQVYNCWLAARPHEPSDMDTSER
ncbi:hypothetical protein PP600_04195 [Mycobacteroides abscessus]|nr:hypothetical protein [Mycobacteroides abscessus]MDM2540877.1 hypothetical protein [Mycobacteroides abscessus]